MNVYQRILRRARRLVGHRAEGPSERYPDGSRRWFDVDQVQAISDLFFASGAVETAPAWQVYRHAHLRLPTWFRHGLDPLSDEYAGQQQRLWQLISGISRPYEPAVDEQESPWGDLDPVRTPGYYVRRDPGAIAAASDHVLASGMILKHSGLTPGQRALEYGAGFAQTALALARFGVAVDTVDISETFCGFVRRQAEFFRVPLEAFQGEFGLLPRAGVRYDLIWFYESFHHCLDFQRVVPLLRQYLNDGGRVILAGEPMVERENDAVPYPWGVRLHSEVCAVVRRQHWFELGFSESFLFRLFASAGFQGRRIDCEPSLWGRLYVFDPITPS